MSVTSYHSYCVIEAYYKNCLPHHSNTHVFKDNS